MDDNESWGKAMVDSNATIFRCLPSIIFYTDLKQNSCEYCLFTFSISLTDLYLFVCKKIIMFFVCTRVHAKKNNIIFFLLYV